MALNGSKIIAFVQWPEGLLADTMAWSKLAEMVDEARPDLLVTNDLPFGPWLGSEPRSARMRDLCIERHEEGLEALIRLNLPAVISTRPVMSDGKLVNEAFLLRSGQTRRLHTQQVFAAEGALDCQAWFTAGGAGFEITECIGLKVGVLLGAEALYPEQARRYGRLGADLIVVPRASGRDVGHWKLALAMASLVSGCFVVSSNRFGHSDVSPRFSGAGMAYGPGSKLLKTTGHDQPVQTVILDPSEVSAAKQVYPCTLPLRVEEAQDEAV